MKSLREIYGFTLDTLSRNGIIGCTLGSTSWGIFCYPGCISGSLQFVVERGQGKPTPEGQFQTDGVIDG
jgi:hypothetical protein